MFGFPWRGKQTTVKNRKGRTVTLLNPAQKGQKFAFELKAGKKVTNIGDVKLGKNGRAVELTETEAAYRSGYLDARKDSAKVFKHYQKNGTR